MMRGAKAAALAACLGLSGCGAAESIWASDQKVAAARYVSPEPPSISLLTMVTKRNEMGAHSALLVNGSQVVLYDPAGTFRHPQAPERNDVFYGITPVIKEIYEFYHARQSTYVIEQKLPVSRDYADRMIARMEAQGPSPKMYCGINTSEILRDFPEFAHVPRTFYPGEIMDAFGQAPGVTRRRVDEGDVGQNFRLVKTEGGT